MEGDLSVQLFLKDSGTAWAYVPGASRGSLRFGGALEPLVWGRYQLYQSRRRMYLKEVEVTEDFWELRRHQKAILQAVQWIRAFERYLITGYPYNDLLALFYWALKSLSENVPPQIVNARFLWRWLLSWGIEPDLTRCSSCGHPLDGRGAWQEGSFLCDKCGAGGESYKLDEFARYALSKSFIPEDNTSRLLEQAEPLQSLFVKNLEDNR